MLKKDYKYYVNATFYGIWLIEIAIRNCGILLSEKIFCPIMGFIAKCMLRNDLQEQYIAHVHNRAHSLRTLYNDKNVGINIVMANRTMGFVCLLYGVAFFIVFDGAMKYYLGAELYDKYSEVIGISMFLFVALCYVPVYVATTWKDNYLNYFNQFEKKEERWQIKIKIIALIFAILGFGSIFLAIKLSSAISEINSYDTTIDYIYGK